MTRPPGSPIVSDDYRLLVETVEDYAIFMLDPQGRVATWNAGAEKLKGYKASEILGRHFSTFYPAEDCLAHKPEEALATAEREGRAENEGWRIRKDGTRFWANAIITALHDEEGALVGFAKITRDLTERRATEEELRRSEERFHHLVDAATDYAIFMLDPAGLVATWNEGARKIKGYEAGEIIGRHFSVFYTSEDRAAKKPNRVLETVRREGRFEDERWRVRKDGTRFWANVVITALRDELGEITGFVKVTRDLTARREAEHRERELLLEQARRSAAEGAEIKIRESEERHRALSRRLEVILEGVADGITVQDRSGALIFANTTAAVACGFPTVHALLRTDPQEVLERFEVFDERGEPFDLEQLPGRRVLEGAVAASALMRVRERATGRSWWSQVRSTRVLGADGETDLAVNILHDVTADRRREEQERIFAQATAALSASLDYRGMLSTLAALLAPGLADWCAIHLLEGTELETVATAHADPAQLPQAREFQNKFPPNPSERQGVWNVIRTGRAELFETLPDEQLARFARDPEHLAAMKALGMRSALVAPIRIREKVWGTITLISSQSGRRYDRLDVALTEELGRRAGASVENARLYVAERSARERLELLARAGEAFSGTFDYEEILQRVIALVVPVLGDFAYFEVTEPDGLRRVTATNDDHEVKPARLLGSAITVPLQAQGEVFGSLTLAYDESGRRHSDDDVKLAEELARRAAIAVAQARLYADAQSAARRAEEANRIKDEFLATVSHELRTPLNAIVGWSAILRDRVDPPTLEKGLEVIHRNARAQSKIIDDILDVSRIITGKLRLDLKPTDPSAVIQEAMEVVRPSAVAKDITLSFDSEHAVPVVFADPERLQQVVWNLLSNAVKFTERGGSVSIALRRESKSLVLAVTDTGRGIDVEFLPYVFDRFKQADSSTTRRAGGLGLGLAIVRHIVELHGGHVSVDSGGVGKGATFTVSIPISATRPTPAEIIRPPVTPIEPRRVATEPALAGKRVLVVEDDDDGRAVLVRILEESRARVSQAANVEQAMKLVEHAPPDLIASDIGLPDEDGYAFIRKLRALPADRGGNTPAVALTAYARAEDKSQAMEAGFDSHLAKPVDPTELIAVLSSLSRPAAT
ncbi:MAG: PAS domain S-box protein [Polyangiaceae bacterium]|nr:PAS domain S-box protein [Polyangiaceae bacterium]